MTRRLWLLVSLAALFGLRAPVCVVACMNSAAPAQVVESTHPPEPLPPCHGAGSQTPEAPPPSHHECDCDQLHAVLASADSAKSWRGFDMAAIWMPRVAPSEPRVDTLAPRRWRRSHDLPPPDLLLLKSTLLI